MVRERNNQRAKFWNAQRVLAAIAKPLSEAQANRMIAGCASRVFIVSRYPKIVSHIAVTHGGKKVDATRDSIHLPIKYRNDHAICLLVSRLIFYRSDGNSSWAWQGWQFCAIYIDVVQALMGKAAADLLKNSLRGHRARWTPKVKRVATPEMIARLAEARSKRLRAD